MFILLHPPRAPKGPGKDGSFPNRELYSSKNLLWLQIEMEKKRTLLMSAIAVKITYTQGGMISLVGVHLKVTVVVPVTTTFVLVSVLVTGYT